MRRLLTALAAAVVLAGSGAGVASAAIPGAAPPPVFRPPQLPVCPAHHRAHEPRICHHHGPVHLAMALNESLGNVAVTHFDFPPGQYFYTGDALYVNVNVLSQGLYPVIYAECTDSLTIGGCASRPPPSANHSDTNFNWVQVTGNWYHLVEVSNPSYCMAFAASTPNTPLVIDTCQAVTWEEFYWGGCHQGIQLRYNYLWFWYQGGTDTPMGLIANSASEMAWTSGYAGCTSVPQP